MSVKQDKRLNQILTLLSERKKMDVSALAEALDVSQVTMRKDLDALEARGFIRREHGFAQLNAVDHISSRLAYHYEEKKRIAACASELVVSGDTVMIESGSCCAILAELLAQKCDSLTIVTNSAFIAAYVRDYRHVQVVLLGGIYQHDAQCMVGPMVRETAANFHVRYFFIGTDGWSERFGFTNKDALRAQAVRDMASACDEMVVLTESEKFSAVGTVPLNIKEQPRMVITDAACPPQALEILTAQGIQVIKGDL
ncbi:MAG: DeoR/GlpR transcriptional regulator [Oscillospiraceae bacterium]|nr:DeoR/GlpR transcriptional regulator [Oscillospiraceae bacterium]